MAVPQIGPTIGAFVTINGRANIPQPSSVKYIPPRMIGTSLKGQPIYQGLPNLELTWKGMDIDGFQAISVEFFTNLNSPQGPLVTVVWTSPYVAGAEVTVQGYLQWPIWEDWSEVFIKDVKAVVSSVAQTGQSSFF